MKHFKTLGFLILCAFVLAGFSSLAHADGLDLAYKNTKNFQTFTGTPQSGDKTVIFDASDNLWKTRDATTGASGVGFFQICGDATTVNNNSVYYGPGSTLTANIPGGRNCDITAAGNTTEATADAPVFTNQAIYITGMQCFNQADQDASITYTLRDNAGATTPSVTCTIADNERDCVAAIATTTAIAAGDPVSIRASSTSDIGASKGFNCTVFYKAN